MNDALLLKLAFFVSSFGLCGLFFLSSSQGLPLFSLSDLSGEMVDSVVLVRGEVVSVNPRSSLTLFVLDDGSGKMDFVFFDDLDIGKGALVEVEGKVGLYKGNLQVVVEKIHFLEYIDENV